MLSNAQLPCWPLTTSSFIFVNVYIHSVTNVNCKYVVFAIYNLKCSKNKNKFQIVDSNRIYDFNLDYDFGIVKKNAFYDYGGPKS